MRLRQLLNSVTANSVVSTTFFDECSHPNPLTQWLANNRSNTSEIQHGKHSLLQMVSSEETQYIRTVDNLIASRLSLKVQLQAVHFAAAGASTGVGAASSSGTSNSHMMNAFSPGGTVGNQASTTTYGSGSGASGGALVLRCTAQIGDLYQEYKEIELGTPQRDPVPARVTSSGSGFQSFLDTYFGPSSGATPRMERQPYKIPIILNCIFILLVSSMCVRR